MSEANIIIVPSGTGGYLIRTTVVADNNNSNNVDADTADDPSPRTSPRAQHHEVVRSYGDMEWLYSIVVAEAERKVVAVPPPPNMPLMFLSQRTHRIFCDRVAAFLTEVLAHPAAADIPAVWSFFTADKNDFHELRNGLSPSRSSVRLSRCGNNKKFHVADTVLDDARQLETQARALRAQLEPVVRERARAAVQRSVVEAAAQSSCHAKEVCLESVNAFDFVLPWLPSSSSAALLAEARAVECVHSSEFCRAILRHEAASNALVSVCERPVWDQLRREGTRLEKACGYLIQHCVGSVDDMDALEALEHGVSSLQQNIDAHIALLEDEMGTAEDATRRRLCVALEDAVHRQVEAWEISESAWGLVLEQLDDTFEMKDRCPV